MKNGTFSGVVVRQIWKGDEYGTWARMASETSQLYRDRIISYLHKQFQFVRGSGAEPKCPIDEGGMESGDVKLLELMFDGSIKPTDVKLSALEIITQNFSEERKIGEGGFASVYRGVLQNGEVAVKRIRNDPTLDEHQFQREVSSLLNVSHKNIVRFIGFCSHTEHKALFYEGQYIYAKNRDRILCFEYIKNGSLEKYISDELRGFPWDTRYFIIKGICEGLHYLHVEKQIIHMDLKPANILIDNNMVAKITDFGLSRMEKNTEAKTTTRASTPGYAAPEYIDYGKMSVKYDVYSLGVIIIELVTGIKSIPDTNKVLRRWRHRLHKSGNEAPFRCQQIAKLMEIGILCQEKDPYKRPFIYDITRVISELENMDNFFVNVNESTVEQISPYLEDGMLGIEPLELRFPFKLNNQISCSLELTNETNSLIAFSIQTTSSLPYSIQPNKDIVAPGSKYRVNIILKPLDMAPDDKHTGDFIVWSTKVNNSLTREDITEDIFNREGSKLVDEVNLTITYKAEAPQIDVPLVPPKEAESKISAYILDEVIQFDPPELSFPSVSNKKVLSSVKIVNITEYYVSFILSFSERNTAHYCLKDPVSIMQPGSTQLLTVTREEKKDAVEDMQFNDEISVWYAIVTEDMKASDLALKDYIEQKKLPIVLTKINAGIPKELIQFDPPELSFPCLNKTSLSSVNIVNNTDCFIGFNTWSFTANHALLGREPSRGILPPRYTQRVVVKRKPKNKVPEEMQCNTNDLFVWNMIVSEGVESNNLMNCMSDEDSKVLPLTTKASPCSSNELIQFDPPELSLPFIPNRPSVFTVNLVNNTDYHVGFNKFQPRTNVGRYYITPAGGVMPPGSTQRLVVKRVPHKKEQDDMQCEDKFFLWSSLVSEGVEAIDFVDHVISEESKEFPIVYQKTSLCTSDELIRFDPPQLPFDFLPNQRVSMLRFFKIVNVTDHIVGFSKWSHKDNSASYIMEPCAGILQPQSTLAIKVRRVPKENETEDVQCKDKIFMWNGIVTENVEAGDVRPYWKDGDKELPVVLTKTSSFTTDELIQIDPPDLHFPFLSNKEVLTSIKISNLTDYIVGFNTYGWKTNAAWYYTWPSRGILPPRSTQKLVVTGKEKEGALNDKQFNDKYFVWKGIVSEGVKDSDLSDCMSDQESIELPIVLDKISAYISDEVIQFDPPELSFPSVSNKKVLSSIKIVNITEYYVSFILSFSKRNTADYCLKDPVSIMQPGSTQLLTVTREEKKDAVEDMQFNDEIFVWYAIVTEDMKASDLAFKDYTEHKKLPIVLTKINAGIPKELIQFDPPELSFPCLNKTSLSSVNIVNNTDYFIGFNTWSFTANHAVFGTPGRGILPPRYTQRVVVKRKPKNNVPEEMQRNTNDLFVWNMIVSEGVESNNLMNWSDEDSKVLPLTTKASPCSSNELIQFDPPELSLPFIPNRPSVFTVNLVNNTDYHVGFNKFQPRTNVGRYYITPAGGVMPPGSTQRLVVKRVPHKKEQDDMQCEDKFFLWSSLVSEGVEAIDFVDHVISEESKEFPIVYQKTSLCTSDELIRFDPPQLPFDFLPNQRVSMLRFFKIVNVTDHIVGFSKWSHKDNSASYIMEPCAGILQPRSTLAIKVRRVPKENETEDVQCKDKIFMWNGIVTENVEAGDVRPYWKDGDKELPVVLTKTSSFSTDELIQIDPPDLHFPFLSNKEVLTSIKIINLTDYIVGFNTYEWKTNATWYYTWPSRGILPPRSTQKLVVTRKGKEGALNDKQFNDKYFVWKGIVSEGVKDSDLSDCMADQESIELPIVLDKISAYISDEAIQFDPPELSFPSVSNKKVLSSIKIVNITEYYVSFILSFSKRNTAHYCLKDPESIMQPGSTQLLTLTREEKKDAVEDMQFNDELFVWYAIVTEDMKASDLAFKDYTEHKNLPIVLTKINAGIPKELIQFDPPELSFPCLNKTSLSSVNIVNNTDCFIGFNTWSFTANHALFDIEPSRGILPPRYTQRVVVKRKPKNKVPEEMQCNTNDLFVWNMIVSEGVESNNLMNWMSDEDSKVLPLTTKKSLCALDELIQFDPTQLRFPFSPNKRATMLGLFKIVNVTDHIVGFSIWSDSHEDNTAWYKVEWGEGILPPRSTRTILVRRTPKENEMEDLQCKDKIFVWNGILTEGIQVSDVGKYWTEEDKVLPVVLTKARRGFAGYGHGQTSSVKQELDNELEGDE